MKKLHFLLIPGFSNFEDLAQVFFLQKELESLGHRVDSLSGPIFDNNLKAILNEYEFDVVLRIGGGKPHINKKKSKCRFISWVENLNQVETYFDNYNENDIIYTLYNSDKSLQSLNVKSLVPAASFSKGHSINFSQKINLEEFDISYIGNERFFDICDGKQNLIHEKAIDFFNNVNLICKFFDKFSDSLKIYFFWISWA